MIGNRHNGKEDRKLTRRQVEHGDIEWLRKSERGMGLLAERDGWKI